MHTHTHTGTRTHVHVSTFSWAGERVCGDFMLDSAVLPVPTGGKLDRPTTQRTRILMSQPARIQVPLFEGGGGN